MSCRKEFPPMGGGRGLCVALVLFQLIALALASAKGSNVTSKWQTLSGDAPFVIARGGFSGLFPDSSSAAYNLALMTSLPNVILWCELQLTKDGAGICFPDLKLDNSSDIAQVFNDKKKEYVVNGVRMQGLFSVDYALKDLANVSLNQGIYSRTNKFDGSSFPIQTVEDVFTQSKPPALWLNIQHDAFYTQHSLSMRNFVISVSRRVIINYISSPEVVFLRSIASRFRTSTTKLVFQFLGENEVEPSTNQTYGSLLNNLTFIKTFASGIIVPKSYIWPVSPSLYLLPHTSVVSDAHKEGIEVFASGFVNDNPFSFDYSYDPVSEHINFIDNGNFSVDGVITDFPITPSEAIDCFAHLERNASKQVKLMVISKNGASGDYPGCTDLAYTKAIGDGVDVIDCLVQMSKDGTPFCLGSINLMDSTNVAQTSFSNRTRSVPEIMPGSGIFTFDMAWSDITKSLKPAISNPEADFKLFRNPNFKNAGAFVSLADFLALAKSATSLSGVLISIENAAYLAEKEGLSVTDVVLDALTKAGYDKQTTKEVMIQSSNSSVLKIFKDKSHYKLVYKVDEPIRDILNSTVEDIKNFAHSVVVKKEAVFAYDSLFVARVTNVVHKLKSFKLPVYVETFSNEFTSQAWDFLSDPTVEINSFYGGPGIDGVITDFPKTAARYTRNRCLGRGKNIPSYMTPIEPGSLIGIVTSPYLPPAAAPMPLLTEADVIEPPLPNVVKSAPTSSPGGSAKASQPKIVVSTFLSYLAVFFTLLLLS